MAKTKEWMERFLELSDEYMNDCINKTKEVATGSGKVITVRERNIPTIDYFLNIWIPLIKKESSISRDTYYTWLKEQETNKSDTIKKIDSKFKALAADIVANEQKGIFYAKNKLGWTDKHETKGEHKLTVNADFNQIIQPPSESSEDSPLDKQ
jgi:uncharacterized protein YaaR (DUF327 family)